MTSRTEDLNTFLENSIRQDPRWTGEVIRSLASDGRTVVEILKCISRSEHDLEQVAISSYRHLNNFDKIVLASFGSQQCKLRLHVWWADGEGGTRENIHNHRWDFSVAILHGKYRFQVYEVAGGQMFHEYEYHSPKDNGYYVMELVSSTSARCVLDAQFGKGTEYSLSHITLHRVSANADQTVITLMCQGPAVSSATRVLSENMIPNARHVPVDRMSKVEVKTKLERVIAILENGA